MIKTIIIIICMTLCIWIGFGAGWFAYPHLRHAQYELGLVHFCDLTEADRFKVCPLARISKEMPEGGTLTLYVCDKQHGFIETNNIPENSKKIKKLLSRYKIKGKEVVSECKTEYGSVYELVDESVDNE